MNTAPPRFIRTALFPVAGLGTRFLPATKAMPQEMLPIVDKPLIQYAVEEAVAAGIEHVVLVTHRTKRAIEDHFDASHELERLLELQGKHALLYELRTSVPPRFSLSCVRQNEPLGLGHALLCARHLVGDEPFAVLLPDELMQAQRPVLAQMIQVYQRFGGSMVAIERLGHEHASPHGLPHGLVDAHPVGERIERVVGIVDSPGPVPASSLSAVAGRYLLSPGIFDALAEARPSDGQELHLRDGLQRLLACEPVFAYRFEGRRFDCGSKLGFLEATVNFALEHPEVGEAFAKVLGRLDGPATHGRQAGGSRRAGATPAVRN
jgi:UTP--glucose-1-phosphate uridylyltransferase